MTEPGGVVVNLGFAGTGAFAVAALAGVLAPDELGLVTASVSCACFATGVIAFLWGYGIGVVRSRQERVTLGGLFLLAGTAPQVIRRRLGGLLATQTLIAVVAASIRPYTAVAFAALAPMLGLGLMALWGARNGTFAPRDDA